MGLDVTGFALLAIVLTITPGQDTVLVVRNATHGGFAAGIGTTAGVCSGLFFHASLSALGLSAMMATSAELFSTVKLIGAAYLIWLGLQSFRWRSTSQRDSSGSTTAAARRDLPPSAAIRQGFFSNALNPKTATFYLALLPQFALFPERVLLDSLTLAGIHFFIAFAWLTLLTLLVSRSRNLLARPQFARAVDLVAGAALVGFGLRLALARR